MKTSLVIGLSLLFLVGILTFMLMTIPVSAQPGRRTPLAATGMGRPTIDSAGAVATLNAAATSAVNSYGGVPQMAEAALTDIPSYNDAIAATGEFLATQAQEFAPGVYSTTTALPTKVPGLDFDDLAQFTPEQQHLISTFMQYGGISYDETAQTVTMYAHFSETAVNAVLDEVVANAGYDPNNVSADLIDGGAVVTFYHVDPQQNGQAGTLVVTLTMEALDGRVQVEILSATFQGHPIPAALLNTAELSTTLADKLNAAFSTGTELDYTINSLIITDIWADVAVSVSVAP